MKVYRKAKAKNRVEKEVHVQTTIDTLIEEKPVVEPKNEVLASDSNNEVKEEVSLEDFMNEFEGWFEEFSYELRGKLVEGVPYKSNGTIRNVISSIDDEKLLTQEFVSEFTNKHFKHEVKASKYQEHMLGRIFSDAAEHYAYNYTNAFNDLMPLFREACLKSRLSDFERQKKVNH